MTSPPARPARSAGFPDRTDLIFASSATFARRTPRNAVGPMWTFAFGLTALDPARDLQRLRERDREAAVEGRVGRAGGHDAEHAVLAVLERPAGVARYDRRVGRDHVVQRLGVAFCPRDDLLVEGDDPAARGLRLAAAALRVAAGDDLHPDVQGDGAAALDRPQAVRVRQLQHGDVTRDRVAGDGGRVPAVGRDVDDLELRRARDHVVVRQDLARAGDDHPGAGGEPVLEAERRVDVDDPDVRARLDGRTAVECPAAPAGEAATAGASVARTASARRRVSPGTSTSEQVPMRHV